MEQPFRKPLFVLFGASMTEWSFQPGGWGLGLANAYSAKADVVVKGFTGWTTRRALMALEELFPRESYRQPDLIIVFFGANDARLPEPNVTAEHVSLIEFKENLQKIGSYLQELSNTTRVILITPPPVDQKKRLYYKRLYTSNLGALDVTNKRAREYAEACVSVANEIHVEVVDLWAAIQKNKNWEDCMAWDGMHLSPRGHKVLLEEILLLLEKPKCSPSLKSSEVHNDDSKVLN